MSLVPATMIEELREKYDALVVRCGQLETQLEKDALKLALARRALSFYAKERRIPATLAACALHTLDGKDLVDDRFGDRARTALELI